jgi:tetratricopeptide (TPR) repeat protein
MTTRTAVICGALVIALAVAAYVPGLPGEFVYDDFRLVVRNEGLKRPFDPRRAFLRDYYASDFDPLGLGYYRPIAILSNELDYRRGGGAPLPFHTTNIAIHAACVALTMLLARKLSGGATSVALAAGVLFALHPAHAESVAFISGRVDPLATMFALAALWAHLRATEPGAPRLWGGATGAGWLCALFSKEMAITVPVIAVLLDGARDGVPPWGRSASDLAKRYGPFAVAGLIYVPLRWIALGSLAPNPAGEGGWSLPRPAVTIGSYVAWLVLPPYGLHLEPAAMDGARALMMAALSAVAAAALIVSWRRGARLEGALLACTLVALIPVAQFRVLETALSERFLYLPSVFASILLASLLLKPGTGRFGRTALGLLVAIYLAILAHRAVVWRDEVRLWSVQTKELPGSVRAWVNLAHAHTRRGDRESARKVYEQAGSLGLDPKVLAAEMVSTLGADSPEDEERVLLEALEVVPGDGALWQNLGFVRLRKGDADGACDAFRRATELVPARSTGWLGLAFGELRRRNWTAARESSERAVALDPTLGVARAILGESLWRLGRPCEAVRELDGLSLEDPEEAAAVTRVLSAAREECAGIPK